LFPGPRVLFFVDLSFLKLFTIWSPFTLPYGGPLHVPVYS
jgi:hypothetical protein